MLTGREHRGGCDTFVTVGTNGRERDDWSHNPKARLDRAITVGLAYPFQRILRSDRANRIPVLMYHGVAGKVSDRHPYFETNISPAMFARHMDFLADRGYAALSIDEALAGTGNRQKVVVITFDDGYRNFYTDAFPVLRNHGFTATVFVISSFTGDQRIAKNGCEYMTWDEVRTVRSNRITIGSHTLTHPQLDEMQPSEIRAELSISKREIEQQLGTPVESFAYPYAFPEQNTSFVRMLKSLLQEEGYRVGVSTVIGTACRGNDPFFLPRIPVNSHDDLQFLEAKLNGGYDWLHPIQYAYKLIKGVL
jgi:peptidoglycan/xylan/chitin deacetylase (PgdA/CDA1 family)